MLVHAVLGLVESIVCLFCLAVSCLTDLCDCSSVDCVLVDDHVGIFNHPAGSWRLWFRLMTLLQPLLVDDLTIAADPANQENLLLIRHGLGISQHIPKTHPATHLR